MPGLPSLPSMKLRSVVLARVGLRGSTRTSISESKEV